MEANVEAMGPAAVPVAGWLDLVALQQNPSHPSVSHSLHRLHTESNACIKMDPVHAKLIS
jgi:hypothetical protein